MDEILKLLRELMEREPTPKGGIANTPAGIDFIGRTLTKEEKGADMILSGKLTDASRFKPFAIQNIGRDERYRKINEYYGDIQKAFEKSINFLKQNPDIRITSEIRDNVIYNLGVLRRIQEEKTKLEKGILSENKTLKSILEPEEVKGEIVKDTVDEVFDMEGFARTLEAGQKENERMARIRRLYEGPGYNRPNSANYRGYGSFFLPKLHEKGII